MQEILSCSDLVGSYVRLLHTRISSLSFFKTIIRIFRTSFSENTSKKLLLFFTEDGPAYGREIMTE